MGVNAVANAFGADAASIAAGEIYRQRAFYAAGSAIPGTAGAFDFAAAAGALGNAGSGSGVLRAVGAVGGVLARFAGPIGLALTAYELLKWFQSQNKTQPATNSGGGGAPAPGGAVTYGVAGTQYDRGLIAGPAGGNVSQVVIGGPIGGPVTISNIQFVPVDTATYRFSWNVTGANYGPVEERVQLLTADPTGWGVKVTVVGNSTPVAPNPGPPSGYTENRTPAAAVTDSLAKVAPNLKTLLPPGMMPQRSPNFNPTAPKVGAPRQTPGVEVTDPKTGISVRTNPRTGEIEIYDPATDTTTTIHTPPGLATKTEQAKQGTAIGVIPTSCPSPCPEVDLTEVLLKIAEVKQDVSDVQDSVGFATPSVATYCGTTQSLESVQSFLEIVDNKLGFDEPLTVPEGTNGGSDVCDTGTALEALLSVVPSHVVFQGFEVRALRFAQIVVYFNTDIKIIKTRFQMSCPNPIAGLTKAVIKAAFQPRIPGDWFVSLKTVEGGELTGWFASEAAGIAYLTQAATLTTNQFNPATAFTATHRTGKGPDLTAGTVIYPVVAFLYEGPGQSAFSERIVLRD